MTNREKYKQAFAVLHPSAGFSLEVAHMSYRNKLTRIAAAASAACLVLVGAGGIAYAADVGGIQRTIQLWMQGEHAEVVFQYDPNGSYELSYTDANGNTAELGGGGVAFEADGSTRPLTEEELLETLREPKVEFEKDGTVWVYYLDQKVEITDRFENDICYVTVTDGEDTFYLTVHSQGEWIMNPYKYPAPDFDAISAD